MHEKGVNRGILGGPGLFPSNASAFASRCFGCRDCSIVHQFQCSSHHSCYPFSICLQYHLNNLLRLGSVSWNASMCSQIQRDREIYVYGLLYYSSTFRFALALLATFQSSLVVYSPNKPIHIEMICATDSNCSHRCIFIAWIPCFCFICKHTYIHRTIRMLIMWIRLNAAFKSDAFNFDNELVAVLGCESLLHVYGKDNWHQTIIKRSFQMVIMMNSIDSRSIAHK